MLAEKEVIRLKKLYKDGFAYLARDKNGQLYAYRKWETQDTLVKNDSEWKCDHYCKVVNSTLCKFIKWEDEKPISIKELMKEVK